MADFTPTQGRYLAFIHAYIALHGYPPAESEIAVAMCVSPPSVNQMVKSLEKRGLVLRHPGQPRSIQILVPEDEIPPWNARKSASRPASSAHRPRRVVAAPAAPPANLYVVWMYLQRGPVSEKFASKEISRAIEIRGDQTLEQLHQAIFEAHDRREQRPYEFQLGKRPFDPEGPNYGPPGPSPTNGRRADARTATLDDLDLKPGASSDTASTSTPVGIIRSRWNGSSEPSRPSPTPASSSEWASLRHSSRTAGVGDRRGRTWFLVFSGRPPGLRDRWGRTRDRWVRGSEQCLVHQPSEIPARLARGIVGAVDVP